MIDPVLHMKIQAIVDEQGWDDNTVLDLALNFIHDPSVDRASFVTYLREVQAAENEMRTVVVTTYADCTVKETWTLTVPKDFDVDEDNALDLLGGDRYPEVRFVSVTDEVDNEHDRSLISINYQARARKEED